MTQPDQYAIQFKKFACTFDSQGMEVFEAPSHDTPGHSWRPHEIQLSDTSVNRAIVTIVWKLHVDPAPIQPCNDCGRILPPCHDEKAYLVCRCGCAYVGGKGGRYYVWKATPALANFIQLTKDLVDAMTMWGSWEDGVPEQGPETSEFHRVGNAYTRAKAALVDWANITAGIYG